MGLGTALGLGAVSAGGSIISSLLSKRKTKGTQTTTQTFSPEQEAIRGELGRLLLSRLSDPSAGIDEQPIRNRLRASTNKTFNSLGANLEAANVRRGFGRSGATGSQRQKLEIARGEQFAGIEGQLQEYLQNLRLQERNRATEQALLFSSRPTGGTTSQEGNVSGGIGPGIGEATGDVAFLIALSKLMGGGGGGGGGGSTSAAAGAGPYTYGPPGQGAPPLKYPS